MRRALCYGGVTFGEDRPTLVVERDRIQTFYPFERSGVSWWYMEPRGQCAGRPCPLPTWTGRLIRERAS